MKYKIGERVVLKNVVPNDTARWNFTYNNTIVTIISIYSHHPIVEVLFFDGKNGIIQKGDFKKLKPIQCPEYLK